ncbi:MAG TPA: tetratricopeptide repeat protein [Pyrinomonadaceae bacterium]|nr:tetratricopeptide repeat protein [Pyrinomonadaceae bacterium]
MNTPSLDLTSKRYHSYKLIYAFMLLVAAASLINAQGVGSSRGLAADTGGNTIQGRVFFPPGDSSAGKSVKLHLESTDTSAGNTTVTDQDGAFRFNGLQTGNYTVVVDGGKEYESTREPVAVGGIGNARIVQVTIQLRAKADASNPAFAGVPQNALAAYQKGTEAAQKNKPAEAIQFFTQAVAAYPNFALALNELGNQYVHQLQWSKAAETFEALLKLKADDGPTQLNLGIALYNEGVELMNQQKFEDAEKKFNGCETHLREAIRLKASASVAHYYLGLMLLKFKAYDEAQKELELSISSGGENLALAHKILGGVYMTTHKNKEAADELEKYLKLEPKAPDADRIRASIKDLRSKP